MFVKVLDLCCSVKLSAVVPLVSVDYQSNLVCKV